MGVFLSPPGLAAGNTGVRINQVLGAALALALQASCSSNTGSFPLAQGGVYRLPGSAECSALVLVFIAHDCPISNGYVPELTRLFEEFGPRGAAFVAVYAEADLGPEAARRHAVEFGFGFPAIRDPSLSLARRVGATVTPEAAVLSPGGELLYRGRIDDRYYEFRKQRSVPTSRNLRDALASALSGRGIAVPRTEALGCAIYFPTNSMGEKP